MSRDPEEVNKLTESTYRNVMEQFNPGLRNLINLGKSYEKSVAAMTIAGKMYFDAVSKIGENAAVSPVSRELGVVLMEVSEVQKKIHLELEDNFKRFHKEIIAELERKTELDVKYMNATFKRYQTEHKVKQDFLERSHSDLKKLRRKSQGKNASKYESKENECLEVITVRQMDMQKFVADGCREALLEEKRRFCFLVDKHCNFSYHMSTFHDKAKEMLSAKLPSWQDKCGDATKVPESVMSMIEGLRTPLSTTPQPSPKVDHHTMNNTDTLIPPPAPTLKAQTSPLANMFHQDEPKAPVTAERISDNNEEGTLPRSVSMGMIVAQRPKVRTIFPHTAGNNDTLLSFDEGDIITILVPEEKDGWLYGELEKSGRRGWFPSSYCRPYIEPVVKNSPSTEVPAPVQNLASFVEKEPVSMELPPPDYSNSPTKSSTSTPSPENTVSEYNGTSKPPFLSGGNPFATVKLRPTVTNDRSAPVI
uniref:BAR/IMD domain-containing adapter protein 2-like 1 n=1 Tax=Paramormyrops kingsleyae TaxID=1676925 RepID=A0A3B3RFN0_9TELE|nr:brain-specific angiogenesis inhibitor 1-associated protein 2-like protein 1 isoform X2 [Paramormyrops kingsleyae]